MYNAYHARQAKGREKCRLVTDTSCHDEADDPPSRRRRAASRLARLGRSSSIWRKDGIVPMSVYNVVPLGPRNLEIIKSGKTVLKMAICRRTLVGSI